MQNFMDVFLCVSRPSWELYSYGDGWSQWLSLLYSYIDVSQWLSLLCCVVSVAAGVQQEEDRGAEAVAHQLDGGEEATGSARTARGSLSVLTPSPFVSSRKDVAKISTCESCNFLQVL